MFFHYNDDTDEILTLALRDDWTRVKFKVEGVVQRDQKLFEVLLKDNYQVLKNLYQYA
jgi:hypothetical protein